MFTTYTEVLDWLLNVPALTQGQALRNLQYLRTLIQQPLWQPKCPIITITGTNGKGSTVQTLSAIFTQAGYYVGCFTSPHLQIFNERIAINERAISDADFVLAAQAVADLPNVPQHFFSLLLLMALWHFKRQAVDIIFLEVGLGGRLDPCNALDATLVGITSIDLDHTHLLGDTREQIAYEKACLMRPKKRCVVGDRDVPKAISAYAANIKAPLQCLGLDFDCFSIDQTTFLWHGSQWCLNDLPQPRVKLSNLAVALAIVEAMQACLPVPVAAIKRALAQLIIPGRYQKSIYQGQTLLLDVAHNPAAIQYLLRQIQKDFPKKPIHLIFAMMQDKDWRTCFELLSTLKVKQAYFPRIEDPRALDNAALEQEAQEKPFVSNSYPTIKAALAMAVNNAIEEQDLIVVTGSFRVVGGVLNLLK